MINDAPVNLIVSKKLKDMIVDIAEFQSLTGKVNHKPFWQVYERTFFDADQYLDPSSVDIVVTSPPYLNNYHYVRNSRPQMFWSRLVQSSSELKRLETDNFGKFWQTVRGSAPIALALELPELEEEIETIRRINEDRGVYGGGGWANYVTSYMNDLDRFCGILGKVLKPGGTAVVVVGNSIVQGREIRVDERLEEIANLQGLSVLENTRLRERVGSSITNSGARVRSTGRAALYDAAVVLRRQG